jgi:hypothetical protein
MVPLFAILTGAALACDAGPTGSAPPPESSVSIRCPLDGHNVFDGGPGRDGIPSLVNPPLIPIDDHFAAYLDFYVGFEEPRGSPPARVVSLLVDGQAVAIPHNVLWWHEIVNVDLGGRRLAVSYCPLTGSAMVFDATEVGASRFGVSGLLYRNNLVMFDAESGTLWPQMCRAGSRGAKAGVDLSTVPAAEMHWDAWKVLHPDGRVVSWESGWDRDYSVYPYGDYEDSERLLFPMLDGIDGRLPVKERVLGIPFRDGGVAFPFTALAAQGERAVVTDAVFGTAYVVLWDGAGGAAVAFEPRSGTGGATLAVVDGTFVDAESGSTWTVEGVAVAGPRAGERLVQVSEAFVAFWFAWAAFQPATRVWQP